MANSTTPAPLQTPPLPEEPYRIGKKITPIEFPLQPTINSSQTQMRTQATPPRQPRFLQPRQPELPLPPAPPANLEEAKRALKAARGKRDLAVRECDELYVVTQRFRLKEIQGETLDFKMEKKRRIQAEERIKELEEENQKLRNALRALQLVGL